MSRSELNAASFQDYPPAARAIAQQHVELLRQVPQVFAVFLIREVRRYDWSFPAERRSVDDQFSYLNSIPAEERNRLLKGFELDALPSDIRKLDWIRDPEYFIEELTGWLWSSHQIDAFSAAATQYTNTWRKAHPEPPPPSPRLSIVVLGNDLRAPNYPLFRKLRPHGVFLPAVDATDAWSQILAQMNQRAAKSPGSYRHWYVDGTSIQPGLGPGVTTVSWVDLAPVRRAVLTRMHTEVASGHGGPEELRTRMAETNPHDVGLPAAMDNDALARFKVSVLTEGSGTQIFSTTFVQWTAREALRRAQPCTLLMRFAPRQRHLPMNEMLAGTSDKNAIDPGGSLVDADMGAFYTWIDQRRLTGAGDSGFVAWSEAYGQAVVIGPMAPRGVTSPGAKSMKKIFEQFL